MERVLHASFKVQTAELPSRGAASQLQRSRRPSLARSCTVVLSEADHDVATEELRRRHAEE